MIRFQEQDIIQMSIEKLTELHGTSVLLVSSKAVGGGCINHALKISTSVGDYFLKWNATSASDTFLKEAEGLAEMASVDNPFLHIPKVIWCKKTDDLPGMLLLEYLESTISSKGFDEQLGRGIAQLHRKTASAFGFHHDNYCGLTIQDNTLTASWPEFFAERRIWALVQQLKIKRQLSSNELLTYEKLVAKIPALLSHRTVPSLIHGDLWSGNYMHSLHGPALIDPACYYADREMELGMMKLFGGFSPEVWEAYQEEFTLQNGWQERNRLYQLYHVLNHYLLFGVSYKQHALEIAEEYI
jgi:protein-ribulosamine 3-kinase